MVPNLLWRRGVAGTWVLAQVLGRQPGHLRSILALEGSQGWDLGLLGSVPALGGKQDPVGWRGVGKERWGRVTHPTVMVLGLQSPAPSMWRTAPFSVCGSGFLKTIWTWVSCPTMAGPTSCKAPR